MAEEPKCIKLCEIKLTSSEDHIADIVIAEKGNNGLLISQGADCIEVPNYMIDSLIESLSELE